MKVKEILDLTFTVKLDVIAKEHLSIGEKRLRAILKEIGCRHQPGKKGWIYTGENQSILEKSIYDFATIKSNSKKTITSKSSNEIKNTSHGNSDNASNNNSESTMTIEEAVEHINNGTMIKKKILAEMGISDAILTKRIKEKGYVFNHLLQAYELENDEDNASNVVSNFITDRITTSTSSVGKKESTMKAEIQAIIEGKSTNKPSKIYKGIYFDSDIAMFLDNIQHGNKSELVNKIIRQYLIENDLI